MKRGEDLEGTQKENDRADRCNGDYDFVLRCLFWLFDVASSGLLEICFGDRSCGIFRIDGGSLHGKNKRNSER